MDNTVYTVDYFIKKFEAIPALGVTHLYNGCALGQCGLENYDRPNVEASALANLLYENYQMLDAGDSIQPSLKAVWIINDGLKHLGLPIGLQFETPKQRILAALYNIKAKQQPEVKERIVYVTVDAPVRELQKVELIEN